jgi:two-component system sensor histidine kinase/response regulator
MVKSAIDLPDVLERVQDDWELLLELLDIFQQDYSVKRPNLGGMVQQKNFDKIRDISHSLKGAAGNISAKEMFQSFYQLEKMAENKELGQMEQILKVVDQQFVELQACIVQLKKDYKNR